MAMPNQYQSPHQQSQQPQPLSALSPSSQNSKTASPSPSSFQSSATSSFVQVDRFTASPVKEMAFEGEDSPLKDESGGQDNENEDEARETFLRDVPSSPFVSLLERKNMSVSEETTTTTTSERSFVSATESMTGWKERGRSGSGEKTSTTTTTSKANKRMSLRFPIKVSGSFDAATNPHTQVDGAMSPRKEVRSPVKLGLGLDVADEVERTLRFNEGLTRAVESLEMEGEGDESVIHHRLANAHTQEDGDATIGMEAEAGDEGMSTIYNGPRAAEDETANVEGDTCLSNFSAIPNADMTMFAKLGDRSPTKTGMGGWTPGKQLRPGGVALTPRSHRRGGGSLDSDGFGSSPTPRRGAGHLSRDSEDTVTTNLLEFTDQFNVFAQSTTRQSHSPRRRAPSPRKTNDLSNFLSSRRTPSPGKAVPSTPYESRALANLLDFDIPPAPTPRSIPSITARELESLKSSFLSQISSLRASLNGKEAEVNSLKEAVGDAERRVGEAMESVREETARRESLEVEKAEWERRGREMEGVLRSVKDEILTGEKEKEEYREKLDASERKRQDLEGQLEFVSSQLVAARKATHVDSADGSTTSGGSDGGNGTASSKEIQDAVERVARELHALYKGKHETKVAALKKSYESRWEKRVKEVELKLSAVEQENERLKTERDATMSGVVPGTLVSAVDVEAEKAGMAREDEDRKAAREMEAKIKGLETEIKSVKRDQEALLKELEQERVEKGELVAAVDEMLEMQSENSVLGGQTPAQAAATATVESFKNSVRGLRAPGFGLGMGTPGKGESKIGRVVSGGPRGRSGSNERKGMYTAGARGIMGNIERMGRGAHGGA